MLMYYLLYPFLTVFADLEKGLSLRGAAKFISWQGKGCFL